MTQLAEVCRLCLIKSSKNSDELFFPIDESFEIKFSQITCTSLLKSENENFPTKVCISCVSELEKHFNYRNGLIDVQKRLYSLLGLKETVSSQAKHEAAAVDYQKSDESDAEQLSNYMYEYVEEESHSQEECDLMENDDDQSPYESEIISFEEVINEDNSRQEDLNQMQEYLADDEVLSQTIEQSENAEESIIYSMKTTDDYIIVNEDPDTTQTPKKRKYTKQSKDAPKQYQCWMLNCNARFAFRATMKKHMLQLHSIECDRSTCLICGKKFDEYSDFLAHVKTHTRKAECEICKLTFVNEEKMMAHRNRVHKNDINERSFPCHLCNALFKRKEHVNSHLIYKHSDQKTSRRFQCKECSSSFLTRQDMKNHEKKHAQVKIECCYCDYTCRDLKSIKRHCQKLHNTLKIYKCFCEEIFEVHKDFQAHRKLCYNVNKPQNAHEF